MTWNDDDDWTVEAMARARATRDVMAQQDEFEAKALDLAMGRYPSGLRSLVPQHERIADALRAEHTRGDAAGYIRGQIEGLQLARQALLEPPGPHGYGGAGGVQLRTCDVIDARIAELRKGE